MLTGLKLKAAIMPADLVNAARDEKLLLVGAGDNTVRVIPPLNVSESEISDGVERLSQALAKVRKSKKS